MQGHVSKNKKNLQAITLIGPTRGILELDPLTVQQLENHTAPPPL